MNRLAGKSYIRALQVGLFAALTSGATALFCVPSAHAAVLSVGSTTGQFGGYVCADVTNGSLAAGTPVQAYDCNAEPNQQFELNGTTIYALGGQTCLDVPGFATGSMAVQSNPCNFSASQVWFVYRGRIISATGFGTCLDATNMANGTQLVVNPCSGATSQQWQIK
jgi:Ricin-type beta-trefoil lectin domain